MVGRLRLQPGGDEAVIASARPRHRLRAALKTANLAIVFTDIQGFTERTSRQTLEQNERLLQAHSSLLTPLFKAFGGRIVKSIGDAFLVTFESPTQAVISGIAIQDRLWEHNLTASEDERLSVRVAVNVGEVRLEANDVFGEPVNIAARVEALTEAGEVYFTEAVYLSMNKAEVPSQEVGAFELKGIPGKIKIFRVPKGPYRVEAPVDGAPSSTAQPPFGNLGLSRLPPLAAARSRVPEPLANSAESLRQKAATLGTQVAAGVGELLGPITPERAALRRRVRRAAQRCAIGLGLAIVGGVLWSELSLEGAIRDLGRASSAERRARTEAVRARIARIDDQAEKAYFAGRVEEELGNEGRAISFFRESVGGGNSSAEHRLIELLAHPECRVRSEAAGALASLKVTDARGELESLAEDGGPDEGSDLPLFGCNSKRAAANALRQLEP